MAIEITVPRLGWSGEEATFARWRKQDGEKVAAGDALLELEGDKSLQEMESLDSGILRLLPNSPKTGDIVKVGQVIGYLTVAGETFPSSTPIGDRAPATVAANIPAPATPPSEIVSTEPPENSPSTPRARRVSAELAVDLMQVVGTGKGGRIRERDVRAAAASFPSVRPVHPGDSQDTPISAMRRIIADRMMQSLAQTAPVTLTSQVDATNLVGLRNQFKSSTGGTLVPAYTDIIAKLAAATIMRFPAISGQWHGNRISLPGQINIGIAVDTKSGLVVPVIRDVPRLSLAEVTRTSRALIDAAHARKLKQEAMAGGVFTITNLGAFGIDGFTPIINQPETAILGLGAIRKVPTVVDGESISIRDLLTVSLSFDHRVLDGAPAARFLQALVKAMENPVVWLLDESLASAGTKQP
jgi:pyruvate dehydrogenase E2 component (dihydrolipoamide acetyltransferase)